MRVDKLIAWLHFGLGRLGLLRYLLAKFERRQRPQFGRLVPELLVGLLEALELSAETALLVVLGVEVDEHDEEDHEDGTETKYEDHDEDLGLVLPDAPLLKNSAAHDGQHYYKGQ